jgi:hypothetical protein
MNPTRLSRFPFLVSAALMFCSVDVQSAQCPAALLVANDPAPMDDLGTSVSFQGTTLVAGARLAETGGVQTGAIYVFRDGPSGWGLETKLAPGDGAADDEYGTAVAVRGDTLFVGAPRDNTGTIPDHGSVYVYQRSGSVWSQADKLVVSAISTAHHRNFGQSIALGQAIAIIGAPEFSSSPQGIGKAYIRQRIAGVWTETAVFAPADGNSGDNFGLAVAIDGNYAVVGAPRTDDAFTDSGSVYVYERVGSVWNLLQELHPADAALGAGFGSAVSLEGGLLAVGASENVQGLYVFRLTGGLFVQEAKLVGLSAEPGDQFSRSVAVGGGRVAASAHLDDDGGHDAGATYVFEQVSGVWQQRYKWIAPQQQADDQAGWAIDIEADRIAVGSYRHFVLGMERAGAVFVHPLTGKQACLTPTQYTLDVGDAQPTEAFVLNTGSDAAGKLYWVLGSLSGTTPGLPVDSVLLPLNYDGYMQFALTQPNTLPLAGFRAFMGPTLSAQAGLLLQSPIPALAGGTVHHAFVVIDLTLASVVSVSNPTTTLMVP